jgi:hypothetical protein
MTRNLKAFGIVLAAAFSMCAMMASMAHASEIKVTATSYPATLTGDQIKHGTGELAEFNTFTLNEKTLWCENVTFHATIKSATENESVTVTPNYEACHANPGKIPVTVNTTGCDYVFHGGEEEGAGHFINGKVDLKCPEGATGIHIFVYASAAKHTANEPLCTYTITPQSLGGGGAAGQITYTNTPANGSIPNDFDIVAQGVVVAVERTQGSKVLCGEEKQNSTYTGAITATGFEDLTGGTEGNRIGVTISH